MGCRHWWVIESPDGRKMLPGECKWCGERREFFCVGTNSDFEVSERMLFGYRLPTAER
jgi:hypothetical protein